MLKLIFALSVLLNCVWAVLIPIRWNAEDEITRIENEDHLRLAFDLIKSRTWPSCQPEHCSQYISGNIEDDEHNLVLELKKLTGDEKVDMIWLPNTIWDLFVLSRVGELPFIADEVNLEWRRYHDFVEYSKTSFGQDLLIQLRFLGQFEVPQITTFAVPAFLSISEILMPKLYNQHLFNHEQTDLLANELESLNLCHQNDETWCSSLVLSAISSEVKARAENKVVLFGLYDPDSTSNSKYFYHSIFAGFMGQNNSYFLASWFCMLSKTCGHRHSSVALMISPQWVLGEGNDGLVTVPSVSIYDSVAQNSVEKNAVVSDTGSSTGKAKLAILLAESMYLLSNSHRFVLPMTESMENIRRQIIAKNFVHNTLSQDLPSEVSLRSARNNSKLRLILENGRFSIPKIASYDDSCSSGMQTIDSFLSENN